MWPLWRFEFKHCQLYDDSKQEGQFGSCQPQVSSWVHIYSSSLSSWYIHIFPFPPLSRSCISSHAIKKISLHRGLSNWFRACAIPFPHNKKRLLPARPFVLFAQMCSLQFNVSASFNFHSLTHLLFHFSLPLLSYPEAWCSFSLLLSLLLLLLNVVDLLHDTWEWKMGMDTTMRIGWEYTRVLERVLATVAVIDFVARASHYDCIATAL